MYCNLVERCNYKDQLRVTLEFRLLAVVIRPFRKGATRKLMVFYCKHFDVYSYDPFKLFLYNYIFQCTNTQI